MAFNVSPGLLGALGLYIHSMGIFQGLIIFSSPLISTESWYLIRAIIRWVNVSFSCWVDLL